MLKKRLLSMLLCLCMVVGMLPAMTPTAEAIIMETHYRVNLSSSAYTSSNPFYQSGWWGECTWYCWGRAMERCGIDIPCRGNASSWYNDARNSGRSDISVGTTPRENSIVVLEGFPNGHVAFVEKLDGSTAYTTEANITLDSGKPTEVHYEYYESSFDVNEGTRWGGLERVVGYIYLGSSSTPSQPTYDAVTLKKGDFYAQICNPRSGCYVANSSTEWNVALASSNPDDPRQIWHFIFGDKALYKVVNEYDGTCLDAWNWGKYNGANVGPGTDNGTDAQRWWLCGNSSYIGFPYSFYFVPGYLPGQEFAMDVYDGGKVQPPGTNIQLYENWYRKTGKFTESQDFRLIEASGYSKPAKPSTPTFRSISATPAQTTISWNSVPTVGTYDSREYALNIYNKTTGQYVVSGRRTAATSYTLNLPTGEYRAEISAVNTKYKDYASGYTTRDFTVKAEVLYNVSTSAASGGTVGGNGAYRAESRATVIATPQSGYHFVKWTENGVTVSTNARYQFVVRNDRMLTAVFEQDVPLEPEPTGAPVRIVPTNIQADRATNFEGYGSLVIDGDYYVSDSYDDYVVNTPAQIGLIDREGTFLFPYREDPVGDGGQDTARFWYDDNTVSLALDSHYICGKIPQYYHLDGSNLFTLEETEEEYIGEDGRRHHDWTYWEGGSPVRDGYAVLQYHKSSMIDGGLAGSVYYEDKTLIIDKNGTVTCEIPVEWRGEGDSGGLSRVDMNIRLGWCGEGLFPYFDYSDVAVRSGYMDTTGKTVIDLTGRGYIGAWPFHEGLAAVKTQDEKVGFIDKTGSLVIPCIFDAASSFCDGLCPVQKDGKWGYIDKSGNVVIPFEYDDAYGAGSGLASVIKNGKCGLVDYDNNIVVPLEYDDISSYEDGIAYGIKNSRVYLITEYDPDNPDAPGSVETLSNGVKFVPFSCTLSSSAAGYEVKSGRLPNGVELNSAAGTISGVPLERGVFQFTVGPVDGSGDSLSYQIVIQDNTYSAVQQQSNGYPITQYVGTPSAGSGSYLVTEYQDETLVVDGPYDEFRRLFIDGVEMTRDEDYTAQSGSTILTIYGEALEALGEGTHTIAVEFLNSGNVVKQASQNYTSTAPYHDQDPGDNPSDHPDDNPGITPSVPSVIPSVTPSDPNNEPTYRIDVPSNIAGGTVKVSATRASRGTTVTITATPDSGYELDRLIVTDAGGNELHLTDKGDDKYTFTMPGSEVSVAAEFQSVEVSAPTPAVAETPWQNPFTDVAEGSWYYDAVRFVSQNSLMNGTGSGVFAPDANLSRAMLTQILYNKEGKPSVTQSSTFTDVTPGDWYYDAVTWAAANNIVGGYGNGLYGSNDSITREQLAVMLWRYTGEPAANSKELPFGDVDMVSSYALDALCWATENGVINGKGGGILDPRGQATRAQVAQMLMNYLRK